MKKTSIYFLLVFVVLTACSSQEISIGVLHEHANKERVSKDTSVKRFNREISIAAIGDILIHDRVYLDAWDGELYDFQPMFASIKDYLINTDITLANQESIMGGEAIGLSNYPQFNSPFEIGDTLQDVGVDIVTMANNHTLDRGEQAIRNAVNYYNEIGMAYTGSFISEEDNETIRVLDVKGITVAFLSYTYGTNGMPVPDRKDYLVNLIDKQAIENDVKKANNLADMTIVSYHFGDEYQRLPNQEQQDLAQFAADLGVEVVIGHHPHVLQPVDWVEGKDGNQTLVAYSLGNFLSGQYELYQRIGGIFQFSAKKDGTTITVDTPVFLPTFVDFDIINDKMTDVQVIPLKDVSDEQLSNASDHLEEIKAHLTKYVDDVQFID
ncbi:CapA family protein [Gracilibacillus sp. S3-1-1]|uniref:CapA family protein n=1 Tax=Gracilibacillus pellucidus TaxID=3095368 RepID=A0ACC6M5U1_9BACI|nr:CapA family protein [Gracilibacillus sp. S3-1-1]MDX8046324.1 CapA family protein [Gracilibacillus sp. S3-1-1]